MSLINNSEKFMNCPKFKTFDITPIKFDKIENKRKKTVPFKTTKQEKYNFTVALSYLTNSYKIKMNGNFQTKHKGNW